MDKKLGRTSRLVHKATGNHVDTPLLVPSFSSKGFRTRSNGKSEVQSILEASSEFLTLPYLVSAFDIHHGHLPLPTELPRQPLIFLDSGGYEVSDDRDLSDVNQPIKGKEPWTFEMLQSTIDNWPDDYASVLINYDHPCRRVRLLEQIELARELFRGRNHLHSFLIKPETDTQLTLQDVFKSVHSNIEELRSFDIIGVAEKELGTSMLDRMANISRLRRWLDDVGNTAPIHIFGALDPLTVCLYYVAGAEIFDGLTWIRYAYRDGCCVYIENAAALKWPLHFRHNYIRVQTMRDNIIALDTLAAHLREFQHTGNFAKLGPHSALVEQALDSLNTQLKKGGA